MVVGILGILKAGGAYLPIDPEYPEERVSLCLEDSKASILLTQNVLLEKIKFCGDIIEIDKDDLYVGNFNNLENMNTVNNLIYVIYTSGSTGIPKGVMLEHRNICNLINFEYIKTNINFKNIVLQFASLSFDVCCQEIFSTILIGGTLHVINDNVKKNIEKMCFYLKKNNINILFLPTAYFKFILSKFEYLNMLPDCIKHIIVAGEKLTINDNFRDFMEKNNIYLHNHYGPSETHVVTSYTMNKKMLDVDDPYIGKPISNSKVYIIDKSYNIASNRYNWRNCNFG